MANIICEKCDMTFKRRENLEYHIKNQSCKVRNFACQYCDKPFTSSNNMYRHMKYSCKIKKEQEQMKSELLNRIAYLEEEVQRLNKENTNSHRNSDQSNITNNNSVNINNGIIANNSTINVLVAYGKENMDRIDRSDLIKGFKKGFDSTLTLIDAIHFNPKYPEYHNIYISNMKNQYAMIYDGTKWDLVLKDELIDRLYNNKRDYIEANLDDFAGMLSKSQLNAIHRWLNVDEDHKYVKKIKIEIKLLLYNKRDMVMNNNCIKQNSQLDYDTNSLNSSKTNVIKVNKEPKVIKTPKYQEEINNDQISQDNANIAHTKIIEKVSKIAGRPGTKRKTIYKAVKSSK